MIRFDERPDAAELDELEREARAYDRGRADFARGRVRIVSAAVMWPTDEDGESTFDAATAHAWYRGWDAANLAAPVSYEPSEEDPF